MFKKMLTGVAATALVLTSMTAVADYGNTDYYGKGAYLGVDLGYGMDNFGSSANGTAAAAAYGITTPTVTTTDSGFAFGFNGGYFFNKYLGAEFNYISYPDYKITVTGLDGAYSSSLSPSALNFFVTGRYPIGQFAVFAQLGYGYLLESVPVVAGVTASAGGSAFAVAVGGDYKFTQHMGVDLKWTGDFGGTGSATTAAAGNFNAITAGFTYYI